MNEALQLQRWTPDEDERLRRMWERGSSDEFIASALGRSAGAVTQRRFRFGLKRDNSAGGNCAKCHRGIYATEGALRYCLSCGYEPPESAAKPVIPPFEPTEQEEAFAEPAPRKANQVTDIETIARQRLQQVVEERSSYVIKVEELDAEEAKLNRILAACLPRPGFPCPKCGQTFKAKNNLKAHVGQQHGVTV